MQDSEVTLNQNETAPIVIRPTDLPKRLPEIPANAFIPICGLREPEAPPVNTTITDEVQQASLTTLKMLGVDISSYQQNIGFADIIDTTAVNEKGELTFPRKPMANKQMLAIVVSSQPLYDDKGNEIPCYQTKDNMIYINLHMMDKYVTGIAPVSLKAGVAAVEETIHYVQRTSWNRSVGTENISSVQNAKEHLKDPVEAEMLPLKKAICDVLYPQAKLQFVGIDKK